MGVKNTIRKRIPDHLLFALMVLIPILVYPFNGRFNVAWSKFIAIGVVALIYMGWLLLNNQLDLRLDKWENRFLYSYFVWMVFTTLFALNSWIALRGSTARLDGLLTFTFYMAAFSLGRRARFNERFLWAISVSALLISLYAMLQFFKIDPPSLRLYANSWKGLAFSTMGNPNFLGSYLVLVLPIPMYLYLRKKNLGGLVIYAFVFFALLCTETRGAWIGGMVAFAVCAFYAYRFSANRAMAKRRFMIIVAVTLILLLIFFISSGGDMINKILRMFTDLKTIVENPDEADRAGTNRFYIWSRCMELIKERPITGFGVENMSIAMKTHFEEQIIRDFGKFLNWDKAHNEYINIMVASGIPALILYLGFIFTVVYQGVKQVKRFPIMIPFLAAAIGYLVQAFFNIQMVSVYYFFMATLGILSSEVFGRAFEKDPKITERQASVMMMSRFEDLPEFTYPHTEI